jgi:quinol monooxygenase YgiN
MKYVVVVRGMLKANDEKQSQATHDATISMVGPMGRSMGNVSHRAYLNPQNRREFMAIDVWDNAESPQKLLQDPTLGAEFAKLFEGQPNVTMWEATGWEGW